MAHTGDGVVRLYRNYDPDLSGGPVQMVSSFRGLNEVIRLKRGAGMVLDWKQNGGTLLASGDSRIVRVWDAHIEAQVTVGVPFLYSSQLCVDTIYRILIRRLRAQRHV